MSAVTVAIRFVDGGYTEYRQPLGILATHDRLVHDGLTGKALIDALLGNDWGPPPVTVTLNSAGSNGKPVEIVIAYR